MSFELTLKDEFPLKTASNVLRLMAQTWGELTSNKVPLFNAASDEPHLSQALLTAMKTNACAFGLTGQFSVEFLEMDYNQKTGVLENRRRSDICYFSDRFTPPISLVFEFKKLQPILRKFSDPERITNTSHEDYCQEGVLRFVQGKYSADQPLAFMVGMVDPNHKTACINGIRASMNKDATLLMQGNIVQPSALFPQLAEFDSVHARTSGASPISLSHLLFLYSTPNTTRLDKSP